MIFAKQTLCALMTALVLCAFGTISSHGRVPAGQEVFAPSTNDELDALVAPIALYPDPLVALVLGAATYPDQVVAADAYVRANMALPWESLIKGAEERSWDPSVTGLVQFSGVLNKLAKNIVWTSTLGEAAANQQTDVMVAVQRMRAKAYTTGNLKSGERIKVGLEKPDVIVIRPVNPKMIYVPSYNLEMVYGTAVTTPGYSAGDSAAISFGLGVAAGSPLRASSCGWRYGYWHIDWQDWTIHCGSGIYFGNPYWWGGAYPGLFESRTQKPPDTTTPQAVHSNAAGIPSTRPGPGVARAKPGDQELLGYPVGANAQPTPKTNAFSGTTGGRSESARGNRSLSGSSAPKSEQVVH